MVAEHGKTTVITLVFVGNGAESSIWQGSRCRRYPDSGVCKDADPTSATSTFDQ